ncbi:MULTISPECIES: hypothetical protein [Pelosinus]|nr:MULTISPECIES: hypothetical protein [Pelosinus]
MNKLPEVTSFNSDEMLCGPTRLVIVAEGFEPRSVYWTKLLHQEKYFLDAIICKYQPEKKSCLAELLPEVALRTFNAPLIVEFERVYPNKFEEQLLELFKNISKYDEVVIDISVMSKLLIIIIISVIKDYGGMVKIIYSEPETYTPSLEEYNELKDVYGKPLKLPSYGVNDVVRTPLLSSIVMQRSPSIVIAFLSLNEQLIRALLSVVNPASLFLINAISPNLLWRERAMAEIHDSIIKEYANDNPVDERGLLNKKTSTVFYQETFELLASIYNQYCYSRRIIIAPTGSKMQALACALIKVCCPDIHIEYPNPESYFISDYSSSKIRMVHEVVIPRFKNTLYDIADSYRLNG